MSSSFIEFITTFIFHLFAKDLVDLHYLLGYGGCLKTLNQWSAISLSTHVYMEHVGAY